MKTIDLYLTEKLHLNKDMEKIKIEKPFDTSKNDSGKLTDKQKSFVNVFVHSLNEENKYKRMKFYPGIDLTFNSLMDMVNIEIDGGDSFVDFYDQVRSTLSSAARFAEDMPEDIGYQFPEFEGLSVEQINEFTDIFSKSAKLIQALYGNILEEGEIDNGQFVTYDEQTGKYEDLNVVWDD